VLNIGKAFCTQQFVGDILGRDADASVSNEADCRRFRRCFFGKRIAASDDAYSTSTTGSSGSSVGSVLSA
jgi:hypothetical protein